MSYYVDLLRKGLGDPGRIALHAKNAWRNPFARTVIVSYPKTGRTWLRVLIGRALIRRYGLDDRHLLDTFRLTRQAGLPPAILSHEGPFNLFDATPYDRLRFRRRGYRDRKVVFLTRDVRDTLVSFYLHESRRSGAFRGSLSEFLRSAVFGVRKVVAYYNLWYRHRDEPAAFLHTSYEALHRDAGRELARVLDVLGADVASEHVAEAVEFASFRRMKRMESSDRYRSSLLQARDPADRDSFKVRKGKIGGFEDYLSADDREYVDRVVAEMAIDGCDWYYAPEGARRSAGGGGG